MDRFSTGCGGEASVVYMDWSLNNRWGMIDDTKMMEESSFYGVMRLVGIDKSSIGNTNVRRQSVYEVNTCASGK